MIKIKDKCPKCKCKETKTETYYGECHGPIIVEEIIKCSNCGNIKYAWEYGTVYIDNWKDMSTPPLRYKIKTILKKVFTKNKDLPF